MVIAPCSIKTAGAIAACYSDTLIARAADVTLKEGRPLILVVRETPLHVGHLRMLTSLAEMGAVVLPPVPAEKVARRVAQAVERDQRSVYISWFPDRAGLAANWLAGWAVSAVLRWWTRRAQP